MSSYQWTISIIVHKYIWISSIATTKIARRIFLAKPRIMNISWRVIIHGIKIVCILYVTQLFVRFIERHCKNICTIIGWRIQVQLIYFRASQLINISWTVRCLRLYTYVDRSWRLSLQNMRIHLCWSDSLYIFLFLDNIRSIVIILILLTLLVCSSIYSIYLYRYVYFSANVILIQSIYFLVVFKVWKGLCQFLDIQSVEITFSHGIDLRCHEYYFVNEQR